MKNIEEINKSKVKELIAQKKHPEFFPGDIIKVGVKMSEQIKKCQTKIISNCGHMILFEKAFEMRKLVKEFIQKK